MPEKVIYKIYATINKKFTDYTNVYFSITHRFIFLSSFTDIFIKIIDIKIDTINDVVTFGFESNKRNLRNTITLFNEK